jgi:AraC-like DNA-binding protein
MRRADRSRRVDGGVMPLSLAIDGCGWTRMTGGIDDLTQVAAAADASRAVRIRQLHSGRLRFSTHTLGEGDNFVGFAHASVAIATSENWSGSTIGITAAMNGVGRVQALGHALDDATIAVGSGRSDMSIFIPSDQTCLGVQVSLAEFQAACALMQLPVPDLDRHGSCIKQVSEGRLADFRAYFLRLKKTPSDVAFESPAARCQSAARQLARLLLGEPKQAKSLPIPAARLRAVRRVNDVVTADPQRAYSLADLCEIACVSPRTLEYAFYEHYGVSPLAFVRALRLHEVWRLLRRDEARVTDAALICGFTHLGKFSADFRRQFGLLPSELSRLLRAPRPKRPSPSRVPHSMATIAELG